MMRMVQTLARRHWRGQIGLWLTLGVTLLALRLILDGLLGLRPLDWPLGVALGLTVLSLAVLVWQVTGGIRAVARVGEDLMASVLGMAAILGTITLCLSAELTHWANRTQSPLVLPDPPAPLTVTAGDAVLRGPIDYPMLARLDATLARADHGLRRLILDSDGGQIPAARALALHISQAGLATHVQTRCASACTLVFLGGTRRSLGPRAQLGFHAYALLRTDSMQSTRDEQTRDRAWLRARGIAPGFIDRVFATPSSDLWLPSQSELRAAGWLTP